MYPNSKFLQIFDIFMYFVIIYSCFASCYFAAFDYPEQKDVVMILEHIVFASFSMEIIIKFLRVPDSQQEDKLPTHYEIAKLYLKSGIFIFDVLATFPFYLIESSGSAGTLFKLLRMIRFPRILRLLDADKIGSVIKLALAGQARGKRLVLKILIQNIYSVLRLVLLTIIITYFLGCLFYFLSDLQSQFYMIVDC